MISVHENLKIWVNVRQNDLRDSLGTLCLQNTFHFVINSNSVKRWAIFHRWKWYEICCRTIYWLLSLFQYVAALPWEFTSSIFFKYFHRYNLNVASRVTKKRTISRPACGWADINMSQQLLTCSEFVRMTKDDPATRQLHSEWCCCQCHARRLAIAACVDQCCAHGTAKYLPDNTSHNLVVDQV